ncbi:MAG TPA: hypothetical protein VFO85_18835, partial [Vicinamibacteria bacterium]|nr:hypothetical protein [Vicinamibacteria bacterium]
EDDRPFTPGPPVANPSPSPSASPTPDPSPSATPAANQPPSVSVTSGGGCHPVPGRPCTVSVNATASDPEGDRLAYGWDGCAQGNAPLALCTIDRPGDFTATVLVSDGEGNFARASAVAHGLNAPPVIRLGGPRPPNPAPSNTSYFLVSQPPDDPDGDESPSTLCQRVTITTSGPCRAGVGLCAGHGMDTDIRTLQGPGTCVVEIRVTDIWGAVGSDRLVFDVLP